MAKTDTTLTSLKALLGPIRPLLENPDVSDILVYGSKSIYAKRRGKGFEREPEIKWDNDKELFAAADMIGINMGRPLSENNPILDARLPDGSRVNIVVEPCYNKGACITIRKFPEERFTLEDIAGFGTIDQNGMDILKIFMEYGRNIIVAGGTGSGKTTLLNALCGYIPKHDIVVTCEDAREISVPCELWVALETKHSLDEKYKPITLTKLIQASLRQNPRWIIVGEVRGAEALDLIRAFNTGHHGIGTLHSINAIGALTALEMMSLQGESKIPLLAIKMMIVDAIQIVIHIDNFSDHSRRITEIIEITGLDYGKSEDMPPYKYRTLYKFEMQGYDYDKKQFIGRHEIKEPPTWVNELIHLPTVTIPDFWKNAPDNPKFVE